MNCNYCNRELDPYLTKYAVVIDTPNGPRCYCCTNCKNNAGYGSDYPNIPLFPPSTRSGGGGGRIGSTVLVVVGILLAFVGFSGSSFGAGILGVALLGLGIYLKAR